MENTTSENNRDREENKPAYVNFKFKKPKPLLIAIVVAVILILVALFFAKGIFVVATVNGSPISRLSLIQELEKQGGKQALEAIIDKKLIETELKKQNAISAELRRDGTGTAGHDRGEASRTDHYPEEA